jgi:hypothetical protein
LLPTPRRRSDSCAKARAAAKISHDNVVTIFEADERGGVSYIAMQFLQGDHNGAICQTTVRYHRLESSARNASVGLRVARVPSATVGK